MSLNLDLLNLFIGMCRGAVGLPTHLRDMGYKDRCIEYGFSNSENEVVVPEIILCSDRIRHSLLFEWKSGQNTEPDQLSRYSKITAQDLQENALLSPASSSRHDIVIIGKEEYIDRIITGVSNGSYEFPVLSASGGGLTLIENQFNCSELNRIFAPTLEISMSEVPTTFVPFDMDSEFWEVAEKVIPQVLDYMINGEPLILLNKIATDIIPAWSIMSNSFKRELSEKIKYILREASENEFGEYIKYNRRIKRDTHTDTWEIISNPLDLQSDKRQFAWRRLQNLQRDFIEALRTGERSSQQEALPFPE